MMIIGSSLTIALTGQSNFLQFSPNADYVSVPHSPELNPSNFTIEAWVNPCQLRDFDVIAAKATNSGWGQGFVLYLSGTSGRVAFSCNWANVASSTSTISIGAWSHIAGTYDGSNIKIYINGVLEGTRPYEGYEPEDGSFTLGLDGSAYPYNGSIAEVRFWDTVKSAEDIQSIMSTRLNGDEANLLAYYPLNQGT